MSSKSLPSITGLPQGGTLSPVLYTLFVNDFAENITNKCILYADDTLILTKHTHHQYILSTIQSLWSKVQSYFNNNLVKLIDNKTKILIFNCSFGLS